MRGREWQFPFPFEEIYILSQREDVSKTSFFIPSLKRSMNTSLKTGEPADVQNLASGEIKILLMQWLL
jgi:hypothetical protein